MTHFTYTPRLPGMPDAGIHSSDPRFHARNLAERKVPVGPISDDGTSFLAPASDHSDIMSKIADDFPAAAWGIDATASYELVALEFKNGEMEPHEFGPLPDTWTIVSDRGRVIRLFRIPAVGAQPVGEIAGLCRVVRIVPVPGSQLSKGETFYWATGLAAGQVSLVHLPGQWLFGLPKASISAARKTPRLIGVGPRLGGGEKQVKTRARRNYVGGGLR